MTRQQRNALAQIASCQDGITDGMLERLGFAIAGDVAPLHALGLVKAWKLTHSNPPGLVVIRYWITAGGMALLTTPERT